MRYKAQWNYRSSLGVLTRGEVIELDPEAAAVFNRDSPGVLVEDKPAPKPKATTVKAKDRAVKAPDKDR